MDGISIRKRHPLHIADLSAELMQRYQAKLYWGIEPPGANAASRQAVEPSGSAAAAAFLSPQTCPKNSPNLSLAILILMTVAILIDMFSNTEISLTSKYSDRPIRGVSFFFSSAKLNLESNLKSEVRGTIKKLISVYRHSKYQYDPLKGQEMIDKAQKLLSRFNAKSSLERIQSLLNENFDVFEGFIPSSTKSRTYRSQLEKVNFLADFVEFDFSSIQNPDQNKFL